MHKAASDASAGYPQRLLPSELLNDLLMCGEIGQAPKPQAKGKGLQEWDDARLWLLCCKPVETNRHT